MPLYRVKVPQSGLVNGQEWPEVGGEIELNEVAGDGMVAAGHLERVEKKEPAKNAAAKVEKRPAAKAREEKR